MARRQITLLFIILLSVLFWFANHKYYHVYLQKGFYTFIALAVIYFIFKLVLEEIVVRNLKEPRTKYSFKKMTSVLNLVIFLFVLAAVWIENPQSLLVAYGLVAAGIAIALQDVFKNFAGGIIIYATGIYRVGDRIEINSKCGDVIDRGIFYTTLMEIKEWVEGDQATGRITIIPNSHVLSNNINNYTKDHEFMWDEISIPITYDSDWKKAIKKILGIVKKETATMIGPAQKEISKLEEKYYLGKRAVEPVIFLKLTDNWITFNIRYITKVRERRLLHNRLSQMILNEIQGSKDIKIASSTLDVKVLSSSLQSIEPVEKR